MKDNSCFDIILVMSLTYVVKVFVLCSVYLITAKLGLALYAVNGFATLVWMPTGIALVSLLIYGYRLWPGVTLGAFIINLLTGASVPVALGIATGNTLEALIAVFLLTHVVHFDLRIARLRDAIGFSAVALFAPLVSALLGVGSLLLGGVVSLSDAPVTFAAWWLGDVLGALVFAPFLIRYLPYAPFSFPARKLVEGAGIILCLVSLSFVVYWTDYGRLFAYVLFLPLTWAALRMGQRGVTLSLVVMSSAATAAVVLEHGTFADMNPQQALFELQLFTAFVALIFLPFAAIVEHGKKITKSLRKQNNDLQFAMQKISSEDEAKSDFIAVLAHELRNPLAPIVNSLELAKLKSVSANDKEMEELIESMTVHVHTIKLLLDDLLDISRISRNKFVLEKKQTAIQSIVNQAITTVDPFFKEKKHTFKALLPQEEILLEVDALRIQQVLVNLLNNAGKYTHPGGIIELDMKKEGEKLCIRLRDNGIGIDRPMLRRIFEPFVQLHSERGTQVGTGLGVGLALTKKIVELHGGSIHAKSAGGGKGSEFVLHLPLSDKNTTMAQVESIESQLAFPMEEGTPLTS
jgi:signal transduction histidine kinase